MSEPIEIAKSAERLSTTLKRWLRKIKKSKFRWDEDTCGLGKNTISRLTKPLVDEHTVCQMKTRFDSLYALFEAANIPFESAVSDAGSGKPMSGKPQKLKAKHGATNDWNFKMEGHKVLRQAMMLLEAHMKEKCTDATSAYKVAKVLDKSVLNITRYFPASPSFRMPSFETFAMLAMALKYPIHELIREAKPKERDGKVFIDKRVVIQQPQSEFRRWKKMPRSGEDFDVSQSSFQEPIG